MNRRLTSNFIVGLLVLLVTSFATAQDGVDRISGSSVGSRSTPGSGLPVTFIRDSSFESGGIWREKSGAFSFINCTTALCGAVAGTGPSSGSHWMWFGGASSAQTQFMEQPLYIPNTSSVSLGFNYWVGTYNAASAPKFRVTVDGVTVRRIPITDVMGGYMGVNIDLSAYSDGGLHVVRFIYKQGNGGTNNVSVDDVTLYKGESLVPFNPGFETGLSDWTVTNATADNLVCNTIDRIFAYTGNCAFAFIGSVNEASVLKQQYGIFRRSAELRAPGHYKVYLGALVKASPAATGTLRMILTLDNGVQLKSNVSLNGSGAYAWKQVPPKRYSSARTISFVEIIIKNTSATGKIFIDDVELVKSSDYS